LDTTIVISNQRLTLAQNDLPLEKPLNLKFWMPKSIWIQIKWHCCDKRIVR
jgi:hypothetical protein